MNVNTMVVTDHLRMSNGGRRTFHVDVVLNHEDHRAYTVFSIDPQRAEQVLRTQFLKRPEITSFEFTMVREVIVDPWGDRITLKVPHWLEHRMVPASW